MKLHEKGVLNLDTPLTKYISDRFVEGDPNLDLITARHVLSHTTGLPNWRSKQNPLRIRFTPGQEFGYSGEGYAYLQSVVTHVTGGRVDSTDCGTFEAGLKVCGTDFDAYMKANLLVPFGMTSSGYGWLDTYQTHLAQPHDAKGNRFNRKPTAPAAARYGAAGNLMFTPTEYAKFLIELLDPRPSDAFRLTQSNLNEMLRPHVKADESSSWALGWRIQANGDVITHGGNNPEFQALTAASRKRRAGFVIMTNSDNGYELLKQLVASDTVRTFLPVNI